MKDKVVIKRDGFTRVMFDEQKIINAIQKANETVAKEDRADIVAIQQIIINVKECYEHKEEELIMSEIPYEEVALTIEEIQRIVLDGLATLPTMHLYDSYLLYKQNREMIRHINELSNYSDRSALDNAVLGIAGRDPYTIENSSFEKSKVTKEQNSDYVNEVQNENSNKNYRLASTQRDLIAGEVSKDISTNILFPKYISEAHKKGWIHIHDLDYFIQPIFNCCLLDIGDMLKNGMVMNGKLIESPKSFQVACTVLSQIIANIASGQYGGQSVDIKHLGQFLRYSKEKYIRKAKEKYGDDVFERNPDMRSYIDDKVNEELKSGIQTLSYQLNTLMTTNGQSPFVTLFLRLCREEDEYVEENAQIIVEILKQRIVGIKNAAGVYVTPAFPKLVYVLNEENNLTGGEFDYVTKLAAVCTAKRMYPDYISEKLMKQNYEGNVFSPMGCRSFLAPWKDENGNYKFEGRFNQGVVSINLPSVALEVTKELREKQEYGYEATPEDMQKIRNDFWTLLDERLSICFKALMVKHNALLGVTSDISPLHWQYGGIARLKPGEKIDKYLYGGYSSISLGYIGIYETTKLITGVSNTAPEGEKFALEVMEYLRDTTKRWKKQTNIGFALYGTPAESLCYRFAKLDEKEYGEVVDVTQKGYYTNSYHVDVREPISVFDKFLFEAKFQPISSGGCISYAEIPNMQNNIEAVEEMIKFIYDNIQYAEFNTKSDYCYECGFDGEIIVNKDNEWECPVCHNKDHTKMSVIRRTCGYLGENFWNKGKTKEISQRVLHVRNGICSCDS